MTFSHIALSIIHSHPLILIRAIQHMYHIPTILILHRNQLRLNILCPRFRNSRKERETRRVSLARQTELKRHGYIRVSIVEV